MPILQENQQAPDFSGINQNEKNIRLSDFKGQRLIIYFYPKDSTPGCTTEACNLRDNYELLLKKGFKIIGISPDSVTSHQKFIKKQNLPFDLIADTDKTIAKSFGVWSKKKFMGKEYEGIVRTTFIIDENGKIEHVITKVNTGKHAEQILELTQK